MSQYLRMSAVIDSVPAPRRGRPPIPGLRRSILAAGADVFGRRDYRAVRMDEVAAACGVGKGTLYRYFPSKRALFFAVTFDGIEKLQADLERIAGAAEVPGLKLERLVQRLLGHFWERRVFFALIHDGEGQGPGAREWGRRRAALANVVERVLAEGIAAGAFRAIDPHLGSEMLLGMLRGANRHRGPTDRLGRSLALVLDVFLRGVGA
jgi:AcrR family transcriptional regulator